MKLLLHTCCAPCSVYCIKSLRSENIEPTVYWFNPNIHPYMEYKTRRDTLKEYTKCIGINAIFDENYGLKEFCKNVINDLENRCVKYCYRVRLEQTARYAKEHGYDTFSTTLLISPYQNHEALKLIGEEMAQKYNLTFLYRDFRPGFKEGQAEARELGLYMQKYCGCVFSEEDRYYTNIVSDKKNAEENNKKLEQKIKLNWEVPGLKIQKYKNGNKEEMQFIYFLKKEDYKKYDEENKKKIFERFMKENFKKIKLIYIKDSRVGFLGTEKIYLINEYKDKGIEKTIEKMEGSK